MNKYKTKSEILDAAKCYKLDDIDDVDTYIKSIPASYLNDANFIFDFIENIRSNFDAGRDYRIYHLVKYIGDDLKKDKTFVMRMFQQYRCGLLFEFIDPILQRDRDVFKAFLSHCCIEFNILQDGYYRNLTKEMIKGDKELSLLLSQQAALCCLDVCNCIDPVFLRDEDFCLKLVDLSDDFFEVLPHEMKNNKKIQLHANRAKRIREERLREPFCCV